MNHASSWHRYHSSGHLTSHRSPTGLYTRRALDLPTAAGLCGPEQPFFLSERAIWSQWAAGGSSGHVRGGGRAAKDLQQAENEARGEIVDLNSGLDRIAHVANSAAEKEASPTAANRCAHVADCAEPTMLATAAIGIGVRKADQETALTGEQCVI